MVFVISAGPVLYIGRNPEEKAGYEDSLQSFLARASSVRPPSIAFTFRQKSHQRATHRSAPVLGRNNTHISGALEKNPCHLSSQCCCARERAHSVLVAEEFPQHLGAVLPKNDRDAH